MKDTAIIIFVKNPDSVHVKTKLKTDTDKNFAKEFYKNSIIDTINSIKKTGLKIK